MNCSKCGVSNAAAACFCSDCGTDLGGAIPSEQPTIVGTTAGSGLPSAPPSSTFSPIELAKVRTVPAPAQESVVPTRGVGVGEESRVSAMGFHSAPGIGKGSITSSSNKLIPDLVIEDKYQLVGELGSGGMGTVYRAQRLLIGDEVAVKILHPQHVSEPQATERFRREAQAAARLKHPNAVSIYDFGVTNEGLVYLVMELVEGQSLREIIKQQGPLTPSAAAEVISQVCAALDEAHRQHVVHRDLKPDNIVVKSMLNGLRVKVLDFGIATLRDLAASNLTQTGSVMGTPHYMSPEQCLGEELDGRADIYSLGVVLYEMLAGVVPFNSPTSTAVVIQHVNQIPPPLRAINLSISVSVEAVAMHALSKRREDRPQTAGALSQELNAAVSPGFGYTVPAPVHALGDISEKFEAPTAQPTLAATMVMRAPISRSNALTSGNGFAISAASPSLSADSGTTLSKGKQHGAILAVIGAVGLLAAAVAVYLVFFSFSAKRAVLAEVDKGNLVKPQGASAYDLYLKYKGGDLKQGDYEEIARKTIAPLERLGDEVFANVRKDPQIESEDAWTEAIRVYAWLNELRANPAYEGRKFCAEGRLALLKKDYDSAMTGFQRSLQHDASSALTLNSIGRVFYLAKKDKTTAQEYYRRATVAEPGWIGPWVNLGALCIETKDYVIGEAALRQAIQLNYQKASPHNLLAQVLESEYRLCEALSEYEIALESATSNPTTTINIDTLKKRIGTLRSKGMVCGD